MLGILGLELSLFVVRAEVGSEMSWRAVVAAPPLGCAAQTGAERPLDVLWAPTKAIVYGKNGLNHHLGVSVH